MNEALIRARNRKKISQAELARRLGVDQTCVSGWETGKYRPNPVKAKEIAAELGISVVRVLYGDAA